MMFLIVSFLLSTLLIVCHSVNLSSPRIVYSAVIKNKSGSSVTCHISWLLPSGDLKQGKPFSIENNEQYHVAKRTVPIDTWVAAAIIDEIHCGGTHLKAPFQGVSSPEDNWLF